MTVITSAITRWPLPPLTASSPPSDPYKRESPTILHCTSPRSSSPLSALERRLQRAPLPSPGRIAASRAWVRLVTDWPPSPLCPRALERLEASSGEHTAMSRWPVVHATSASPRWTRHPDVVHGPWTESTRFPSLK
jgi:hypothetical protein